MIVVREGAAEIRIDDTAFRALIDRVTDGAATSFIETCRPTLEKIRGNAMAKWPVDTGKSKAGFRITSQTTTTTVRANLENVAKNSWASYPWGIHYSYWTKEDLDRRVEEAAANNRYSEAGKEGIRRMMRAKMAGKYRRAVPESLAGKFPWQLWIRTPYREEQAALIPRLQADLLRLARP